MWKFASHSWSSASGRPRAPETTTDGEFAVIGMMIVWTSFVFVVFPKLDLAITRLFAHGQVFWLAENPFLKAVRDISRQSQPYLLGIMAVIVILHVFLPRRLRFCPPHRPLFVLLSFAAGPLLIVQTLKVAIGRVRPRDLLEFGGTADFTPVWQFSAACSRNCSFPSGEAAAAAAGLSLLVFVPAGGRWIAAVLLTPCLLFVAFNRVIFGAHFLSDVMLGWLLTMLSMAVIWRWMEANSRAIDRFVTRFMFQ
ncbi:MULTISPECIES: phosphatase PAP2 family protein [unclassified Rhizobium]|uniref:phosphatase PAP2 family protein n=1 Tax=unclassified Rhizobium TaxID=2613769 RepID=UPI000EA868B4|nr:MULTISPECIES: phosphatase PAP2 family protein [unclassified Rhizobium]AYG69465.1 phosphatase PAP2 family protein [Rhizobium sp. CCGE531]AYG75844.1 phosphatase PAP2 family protein [Rhizobium sp. CCGE532]